MQENIFAEELSRKIFPYDLVQNVLFSPSLEKYRKSISKRNLEKSYKPFLWDILHGEAFLDISKRTPDGTVTNISSLYGTGYGFRVLMDGVRLTPNANGIGSWAGFVPRDIFNIGTINTVGVKRYRLLKGPQSALLGGSAISPILLLETLPEKGEPYHVSTSLTAGSYDSVFFQMSISDASNFLQYSLDLGINSSKNSDISLFEGSLEDDSYLSGVIGITLAYDFSPNWSSGASLRFTSGRYGTDKPFIFRSDLEPDIDSFFAYSRTSGSMWLKSSHTFFEIWDLVSTLRFDGVGHTTSPDFNNMDFAVSETKPEGEYLSASRYRALFDTALRVSTSYLLILTQELRYKFSYEFLGDIGYDSHLILTGLEYRLSSLLFHLDTSYGYGRYFAEDEVNTNKYPGDYTHFYNVSLVLSPYAFLHDAYKNTIPYISYFSFLNIQPYVSFGRGFLPPGISILQYAKNNIVVGERDEKIRTGIAWFPIDGISFDVSNSWIRSTGRYIWNDTREGNALRRTSPDYVPCETANQCYYQATTDPLHERSFVCCNLSASVFTETVGDILKNIGISQEEAIWWRFVTGFYTYMSADIRITERAGPLLDIKANALLGWKTFLGSMLLDISSSLDVVHNSSKPDIRSLAYFGFQPSLGGFYGELEREFYIQVNLQAKMTLYELLTASITFQNMSKYLSQDYKGNFSQGFGIYGKLVITF